MKKIKTLIILLSLVALTGCDKFKEDLSNCGIWLKFEYVLNPEHIDKFTTEVNKLTIFVFDAAGNYVTEFEEEGPFAVNYRFHLTLPAGTYQFVVWGNISDETPLSSTGTGRLGD